MRIQDVEHVDDPLLRSPLPNREVLIVARDPMTGALIGSLVDVSGFQPAFPSPGEDAASAVRRVRPRIVLVDCDSDNEAECFRLADEHGATVVLFSPSRSSTEVGEVAAARGIRYFALPIRWTEFKSLLEDVASSNPAD